MTSSQAGGPAGTQAVLLIVDQDSEILSNIKQSLIDKYGDTFEIRAEQSGAAALELLRDLREHNRTAALLVVRQELPDMQGAELLQSAAEIVPQAKRLVYSASEATDVVVSADSVQQQSCDLYLLRPWEAPETCLYPALDDLLREWTTAHRAPFAGVLLVGDRWSPKTHQVKDFLARNRVPYRWLDIEQRREAQRHLAAAGLSDERLPVLLFADGSHLVDPADEEIAEQIGFHTEAEKPFYDLIIVGGGPAGLAAGVYGSSEGLRTLIIEREAPGGQAGLSAEIENYLGFPEGLSGADLARRAVEQAQRFGVEILATREVTGLRSDGDYRVVMLDDGSEISCHAVLVATGVSYRQLNVPGAEKLTGKGVYYGAASAEALACRNQDVCLLGGGNSAGQAAVHIAGYARTLTIVTIDDSLASTMSEYLVRRIEELDNVTVRTKATVGEVHGEQRLEEVTIEDLQSKQRETLPVTALFVWIGGKPHTDWLQDSLKRDEQGFILAGPELMTDGRRPEDWPLERDPYLLETSIPGVFVAGDVRAGSVKRIAAAVGEGGTAIQMIHQYLSEK